MMFTKRTKRFIAATVMASMMAFPVMAAEGGSSASANDDAVAVINEFNDTVVAAYEKQDVALDTKDFTNADLVAQLDGRNDYIRSAQSAYTISDKSSDFTIDQVKAVNDNVVKVLATRTLNQTLSNEQTGEIPFHSSTQEGYVLTKSNDGWQIARVVDEIYGANLAMDQFVEEFDNAAAPLAANAVNGEDNQAVQDLGGIDYTNLSAKNYEAVEKSDAVMDDAGDYYAYSKAKARDYALKWALGRNPAYSDYSNVGGDCANFTSQCFVAGGLPHTNEWYPGSYQFINVEGQRDMLVNNNRAIKYYKELPVYPRNLDTTGTVVHYFNGSVYYHAVIITSDPMTGYNNIRVSGHTADVKNGPILPIDQIRSFQVA